MPVIRSHLIATDTNQIRLPAQDIDDVSLASNAVRNQDHSFTIKGLPSSAIYREICTQTTPVGSRCLYRSVVAEVVSHVQWREPEASWRKRTAGEGKGIY
jgi:hypothetical protein